MMNMVKLGYTLLGEQTGPRELVRDAAAAEQAGFDFALVSDHYSPWLGAQGHASYAWSVLGAVSQATAAMDLMTYLTSPIMRYHPVVVAQKAATMQILSRGRFALGLGLGENRNERVVGEPWPTLDVRRAMLGEAIDIIRNLFDGGYHSRDGRFFRVTSARLWDLPDVRVPIGVGINDELSAREFAPRADLMIAVEPRASLTATWETTRASSSGGSSSPGSSRKVAQVPVCWDRDEEAAVRRAYEQFRWFCAGWTVTAELPDITTIDSASRFIRPQDVARQIPCGARVERIVEAIRPFLVAGFTDIALVQIGGNNQQAFIRAAESEVLPALRESLP
jgi:G6PDH family F420-dependent oxidoreductase